MKKHINRRDKRTQMIGSSERDFADTLSEGERFAISETTTLRLIDARLRERGLYPKQVDLSSLTREEQRHWAVYLVQSNPTVVG